MGSFTVKGVRGDDLTVIFPDHVPNEARAAELEKAWARVKPAGHWKGSINATVRVASDAELDTILEAIVFFTATEAVTTRLGPGHFRITAPGYWAGPAN